MLAGGDTKVDVMSDVVTVELNSGCPTETHVLIVVQEAGGMPRPLSTYSIEELVESTLEYSNQRPAKQVATTTTVYIAANITREGRAMFCEWLAQCLCPIPRLIPAGRWNEVWRLYKLPTEDWSKVCGGCGRSVT